MKKIFWGVAIAISWLCAETWYRIGHPDVHDIKDLPKDKPALLMTFQNGDPGNARFLYASFTYTARALDDPDLKKHEKCTGSIWSIHPQQCAMVAKVVTREAGVFIDRASGIVAMPFEAQLPGPGDYQLDKIDLRDGHNGLTSLSPEDAKKVENKDQFLEHTFFITRDEHAGRDTVALARHENSRWNLIIHAPPHYEVHADHVRVLPYFPTSKARHDDLSRGFDWKDKGTTLPIGYVNQAGGVVDASTDHEAMEPVRRTCVNHESDEAIKLFRKTAQFRQTWLLEYENHQDTGKRCRIAVERNGERLATNSLGDQLFVQQTISHDHEKSKRYEYVEAVWVKDKLLYAIFHDARKDVGELKPDMRFIDDAFAKLYPDAAAEFPMDRLAQLKVRAESALAIALP